MKNRRTRTFWISLMLALFLPIAHGCVVIIKTAMTTEEGAEHALYALRHPATTRP